MGPAESLIILLIIGGVVFALLVAVGIVALLVWLSKRDRKK